MDSSLQKAVDTVAQKDAGQFRQFVFAELAQRRWVIRWVMTIHRLLGRTFLSHVLVGIYGFKAFIATAAPKERGSIWAVAAYTNERRQFADLEKLPALAGTIVRTNISNGLLLWPVGYLRLFLSLLNVGQLRACYRLVAKHNQNGDFLVACRVASTVGYYLRFKQLLSRGDAAAILVSSDSNPYAMGLSYAAQHHGLKRIYITHGHLPAGPPALDFDLSILDGEALLDVYRDVGPTTGAVVFKGAEGEYRPLRIDGLTKSNPVVGIFASLVMDWDSFKRIIQGLNEHVQPQEIVVRLHPNKIIRELSAIQWLNEIPNVRVSFAETVLLDDAKDCDFVIVGNSSCHLTVLKYGVPSVVIYGLDRVPHDFYKFIELGMVPAFDKVQSLDLNEVKTFYSHESWVGGFQQFDASYPDNNLWPRVADHIMAVIND